MTEVTLARAVATAAAPIVTTVAGAPLLTAVVVGGAIALAAFYLGSRAYGRAA